VTLAQNIITIILLSTGTLFLMISSIGLIRFPDFYTRAHAVGKSDTLGLMLTLAGLAVYNGWELSTVKIVIIILFVMIANPTATHAITRAALRFGLSPWVKTKPTSNKEEGGTS
jgi:multicomponent Na+:H+ antiporter subunit G